MRQYLVHEYTVVCRCGYSQINNDDNVSPAVKVVSISHCNECCPSAERMGVQICFDSAGNRVSEWR